MADVIHGPVFPDMLHGAIVHPTSVPARPDENAPVSWLKSQPADSRVMESKTPANANMQAARTIKASYVQPFIERASTGCAPVEFDGASFGPAMAVEIEADLDAQGSLIDWRHSIWRNASGGGSEHNPIPSYDFPSWHIVNHRVLSSPPRTSASHSLGASANVFAVESFIDELAHETGSDPVDFRLAYTSDARARAVIHSAVQSSGWRSAREREGAGWGIGFARYQNTGAYCAVVADIVVEEEIRVTRLTIAVDVGAAINPEGVINQIECSAIQALSQVLTDAARLDRECITGDSRDGYSMLRFSEIPQVETIIMQSAHPPVGAGEASLGPTAAAIGNAIFDALGVRVHELPITAERILSLID